MKEVAESIMRVLDSVRDNEISTSRAREKVEEVAQKARASLKEGSDDYVALDIFTESANAYLRLVEGHAHEPIFRLDAALASVRRKAERVGELW